MAITVEVIAQDISTALLWKSLTISESIGEPDTLTVDMFELADAIRTLLGPVDNYLYTHVYRDGEILFSGLALGVKRRNDHGAITYRLRAAGWEFLAPKRLVGRPNGDTYQIQQDDDAERVPTAVAIDPNASPSPTPGSISAMWTAYWNFPVIDTDTFVFDILPESADAESIVFSGTDIDGAMNALCASASAAAMWWLANDSPDPQSVVAPNLALHVGVIALPDEGDDGDDLLMGFPSADFPVNVAPYEISDAADYDNDIILASAVPEIEVDHSKRVNAVYVRGATGFTQELEEPPPGYLGDSPYVVGEIIEGGTGWVSSYGGIWGEAYLDAPWSITPDQRDAFGAAYLGAHAFPSLSGSILVETDHHGWHKGQAVKVTDAGLGLAGHWFLIRSVTIKAKDSDGEAMSYQLNVGDTLTPSLGYELRQRRLQEQRIPIRPATRFLPFVGDLNLAAGETAPLTMQLGDDAGKAVAVSGVGARWHLFVNGFDIAQNDDGVGDTAQLFYLTDFVESTDEFGQVTATLHAHADVTADDVGIPWAEMVIGL